MFEAPWIVLTTRGTLEHSAPFEKSNRKWCLNWRTHLGGIKTETKTAGKSPGGWLLYGSQAPPPTSQQMEQGPKQKVKVHVWNISPSQSFCRLRLELDHWSLLHRLWHHVTSPAPGTASYFWDILPSSWVAEDKNVAVIFIHNKVVLEMFIHRSCQEKCLF